MRIGCLQFAPQLGDVDNNLNRADAVLSRADPEDLDLLVLPELAFSGYNFKSLQEISPFLEPSEAGISSLWARTTALKYDCTVVAGYPEKVDVSQNWPTNPEYYNAAIVVSGDGETTANYRKTHLYYTDETWALEGPKGFFWGRIPGLGRAAIGICMDLNPYKFQTPWEDFEFANHVLDCGAHVVIVSMAWITGEDPRTFSRQPQEPDMDTLMYWISRMEPIIRTESDQEVIVIFANRTGVEADATYAGTSAVVGIKSGEVQVYGILGRGDKDLLVVDTDDPPYAKLVYRPGDDSLELESPASPKRNDHSPSPRIENEDEAPSGFTAQAPPERERREDSPAESQRRPAPSYHRDDLSIRVTRQELYVKQPDDPAVHTPTAPSPTPQTARPRLDLKATESITQSRLEPHSAPSFREVQSAIEPGFRRGGDAAFLGPDRFSSVPPLCNSASPFSEPSLEPSQRYWMPHQNTAKATPSRARWTPLDDTEDIISEPSSQGNDNRHSFRSDVSVYNNYAGRPRASAGIPPTPPREGPEPTAPSYRSSPGAAVPRPVESYRAISRPEPSKSRKASRSRRRDRSQSAAAHPSDLGSVARNLEAIAQRAESAQQHRSSTAFEDVEVGITLPSSKPHSRTASRQRKPTPIHREGSATHRREKSKNFIPIAMDPSLWPPQPTANSDASPRRHGAHSSSSELPILRPASENRIRARSNSNHGKSGERPPTRSSNFRHESVRSNTPSKRERRAVSRGRQRTTHQLSSEQSPQLHGQGIAPEPIDLSQFRLIEEYPSANCPVHGSRPPSGVRDRTSSNQRSRGERHNRSQARKRTESNSSAQKVTDTVAMWLESEFRVASAPAKEMPIRTVPRTVSRQAPVETRQTVFTTGPSNHSTNTSANGPKTPVAMQLVYDTNTDEKPVEVSLPPLKCVERGTGLPIARSRSAAL